MILAAPGRTAEHWALNPTLVVVALAGGAQTPGIPELGSTATIRWSEDIAAQEEQIVTTVLRDVLLAAFHRALGLTVPDAPNHVVLNWLPPDLAAAHAACPAPSRGCASITPGAGSPAWSWPR